MNKKMGHKKFHKKSMVGFLVGYEPGKIYRIYHPGSKQFKVSRDVIFSEHQFFNTRRVTREVEGILPIGDNNIEEAAPIICDEIVGQPPSSSPPSPPSPSAGTTPAVALPKPPNRRS